MLITGYPRSRKSRSSEVLSTSGNKKCVALKPFPNPVIGATSAVINGKPLICGGSTSQKIFSDCYVYENGDWEVALNLGRPRKSAASIVSNGALWITGGTSDTGRLKSTEFVFLNNRTCSPGPNLPSKYSIDLQCVTKQKKLPCFIRLYY